MGAPIVVRRGARLRHRLVAIAPFAILLVACTTLDLLPGRQVAGTIANTDEIGGGACPLLLEHGDGSRWEVTLPPGYMVTIEPDGRVTLLGPDGRIASTGERVRVMVTQPTPDVSPCRWGDPVRAEEIVSFP